MRQLCFLLLITFSSTTLFSQSLDVDTLIMSSSAERFLLPFLGDDMDIIIEGLESGEAYQMRLVSDDNTPLCDVLLEDTNGETVVIDDSYSFIAQGNNYMFSLKKENGCAVSSVWLCINGESGISLLPSGDILSPIFLFPIDELVLEQLFVCTNVSNFKINAAPIGIAGFYNDNIVGIDNGIFLCTGSYKIVNGNSFTTISTGQGRPGDSDLEHLVPQVTFDANIIEFDIMSAGDSLIIDYVFCSEEYCEYQNTHFNDVIGIFLSGPNINNEPLNIATVPHTNMPISVNTVNESFNKNHFIGNSVQCLSHAGINIRYNGLTSVLTAGYPVTAGEKYHIKIAIADATDSSYDSGLFFNIRSLSSQQSGVQASIRAMATNEKYTNENCNNEAILRFYRPNISNDSLSVILNVLPISTAQMGVDFDSIPNKITLSPSQNYLEIPITIHQDQIIENEEKIYIQYSPTCSGGYDTIMFSIFDPVPQIDYTITGTSCPSKTDGKIAISISGGSPNYTVQWSTGQSNTLQIGGLANGDYSVTVTDQSGCSTSQSFTVQLATVIPTMSQWGLFLFGLVFFTLGVVAVYNFLNFHGGRKVSDNKP